MIDLRKIYDSTTSGTCPDKSPRIIETAFDQIRISIEMAENPCAIAPGTRMVGSDFFRIFPQRCAAH
jgi:hypothetical protein